MEQVKIIESHEGQSLPLGWSRSNPKGKEDSLSSHIPSITQHVTHFVHSYHVFKFGITFNKNIIIIRARIYCYDQKICIFHTNEGIMSNARGLGVRFNN